MTQSTTLGPSALEHAVQQVRVDDCVPSALWLARARLARGIAGNQDLVLLLAKDPACPVSILEILGQSGRTALLVAVAENPNTSSSPQMRQLAHDTLWEVRMYMAASVGLEPDDYLQLAGDRETRVINKLTKNPAIGAETARALWARFTKDKQGLIASNEHYRLSTNPAMPADLLAIAAQHKMTASAVAANPATTIPMLRALATGPLRSWAISGLAGNPNTPSDILEQIYAVEPEVRNQILANPGCDRGRLDAAVAYVTRAGDGNGRDDIVTALAENPKLAARQMAELWDAYENIHEILVTKPWCPEQLIERGLSSPEWTTRVAVAKNLNLSRQAFEAVADDGDPSVWSAAWSNPNLPRDLLHTAHFGMLISVHDLPSARLDNLDETAAETVLALSASWAGSYGDLLDTVGLLRV